MSNQELKRWYFFVECAGCHDPIIFGEAPSPGQEERPAPKNVTLVCMRCGTEHTYRGSEIQRKQGRE